MKSLSQQNQPVRLAQPSNGEDNAEMLIGIMKLFKESSGLSGRLCTQEQSSPYFGAIGELQLAPLSALLRLQCI